MDFFRHLYISIRESSRGQTMTEYAVVLAVITPAIILAYTLLSDRVAALIDSVRVLLS